MYEHEIKEISKKTFAKWMEVLTPDELTEMKKLTIDDYWCEFIRIGVLPMNFEPDEWSEGYFDCD